MSRQRRIVTLVVHRDGDLDSRVFKIPVWLFEALKIGSEVVVGTRQESAQAQAAQPG